MKQPLPVTDILTATDLDNFIYAACDSSLLNEWPAFYDASDEVKPAYSCGGDSENVDDAEC